MQNISFLICLLCSVSVYAQKPGGFSDFDDEIILEDKKKTNKDLDFIDQDPSKTEPPKQLPKKQVNDDELLNNLQSESTKSKKTEKQEASSATRKKVIEDAEESAEAQKKQQRLESLPEDERALVEEEQDQADVAKDEEKSKSKKVETKEEPKTPDEELTETPQKEDPPQPRLDPAEEEEEEEVAEKPAQEEEPVAAYDVKGVEVERNVYENNPRKKCNCKYDYLTPYAQRRGSWSNTLGLGYSTYHPTNYQPDFVASDFETEYGSKTANIDIAFGIKKNMAIGAIALDIGVNLLRASGATASTLTVYTGTAALYYYLDNIWNEPYLVPYGFIGAGYSYYQEALSGSSVYGATTVTYMGGGLQVQLDWLDDGANMSSYEDVGIENTFLFIEARAYPDIKAGPSTESSPDFSSSKLAYMGGLKFEF